MSISVFELGALQFHWMLSNQSRYRDLSGKGSLEVKRVNIHKAAGPDGLPGRVFRAFADQLASVFTDIFNLSLTQFAITICFKQTIIVTLPKNAKVTGLNDYCHIALTSVAMKCFERLVMAHINTIIPDNLDLYIALSHLDKRNTYVRMLFIDYSSVFNTIVPL